MIKFETFVILIMKCYDPGKMDMKSPAIPMVFIGNFKHILI